MEFRAISWEFDILSKLLNWSSNRKILLHMCDTYNFDYLQHSTFRFNLIDFKLNTDFPSQFGVFFIVKSPSVTQRSVSQENAFKKSKSPSPFFSQNYRLKRFFYSNWKQFLVFKIAKFEFMVTVHYSLWAKCTQLWPLKLSIISGI